MLRYILTVLFCLFSIFSNAQNLNLKQLMSFINQPVKAVNDSLTVKGWLHNAELSGIQQNQLYQTYSYGNLQSDKAQALAWFRIHADNGIVNQLYYQVPGLDRYKLLVNSLKAIGTERKDVQSIEDNQINTYYQTPGYIFQTIAGKGTYTIMAATDKH